MTRMDGHAAGNGAASFHVQNQIRRNAQDMQEYLADLGSWEKSIKKKDKQLSRKAGTSTVTGISNGAGAGSAFPIRHNKGLVTIRSSPQHQHVDRKVDDISHHEENNDLPTRTHESGRTLTVTEVRAHGAKAPSAAGHTYDRGYDKWSKFDVDAALRSDDEEDETEKGRGGDSDTYKETSNAGSRSSSKSVTAMESARPASTRPRKTVSSGMDQEKEERERGNALFSRGDFEGAVKSYTRCVGMKSRNAVAFSNRAMAYLKLKEFGKAETDCDAALRLDAKHVKSLQRRAVARNALGKHRAALGDLLAAAAIDPNSKHIRKEISKTQETLKSVVRRAPKKRVSIESESLPAPKPSSPPSADGSCVNANSITFVKDAMTLADDQSSEGEKKVDPESLATFSGLSNTTTSLHESSRKESENFCNGEVTAERKVAGEKDISQPSWSVETRTEETVITNHTTSAAVQKPSMKIPGACVGSVESNTDACVEETVPCESTTGICTGIADATSCSHPPESAGAPCGGTATGMLAASVTDAIERKVHAILDAPGSKGSVEKPDCEASRETKLDTSYETSGRCDAVPAEGVPLPASNCDTAPQPSTRTKHPAKPRASKQHTDSGAKKSAIQSRLPATGYQLEHMWRSSSTSEARLRLLRTVPPSLISKIFRRTPLEVELLEGILTNLGEAFIPDQPATILRWLKSLSKTLRFGMTISLVGEGEGRRAVRELLSQLKLEDTELVEDMRRQYMC